MSQTRPQYHFDLTSISEFNPAIIYGFEAETSVLNIDPDERPFEFLVHSMNQYEDLFNAYSYAETIVKKIREQGKGIITQQNVLLWISEIHRRIARTLAEDHGREDFAGNYVPYQVMRWHQTGEVSDLLQAKFTADIVLTKVGNTYNFTPYYNKALAECNLSTERKIILLKHLAENKEKYEEKLKELNVSLETANKFQAIMFKYSKKEFKLTASEKAFLATNSNEVVLLGKRATIMIAHAWHEDLLTAEERNVIDSLAKVCCRPEEMSGRMSKFATSLADKWQKCDGSNLRDVAKLCHFGFYEETEIHPYFNANGRTATCLINTILRSLEYPHHSITMRDPGNKDDKSSSYSRAIDNIDAQPELLKEHICERIMAADNGNSFSDTQLKNVIENRFVLLKMLCTLHVEFPKFNINQYINEETATSVDAAFNAMMTQPLLVAGGKPNDNLLSALTLSILIESLKNKMQNLRASNVTLSAIQREYTPQERAGIINKLIALTGMTGWKQNAVNGLKIWLEANDYDLPTVDSLVRSLTKCGALKATRRINSQKQTPIIMLEAINPSKLESVITLAEWKTPTVRVNAKVLKQ